jgi:hypothetical protein
MGLSIGMAGKSHWSQSVETAATAPCLTFDVACRIHRQPLWLGSSYRANHPVEVLSASSVRLTLAAGVALTLTGEAPDGASSVRMEVSGNHVAIVADLGRLPLPSTVRWRYRVALAAAPACFGNEAI